MSDEAGVVMPRAGEPVSERSTRELPESFSYVFAALRGVQAGMEYYVAMCPLKLIPKIFLFDDVWRKRGKNRRQRT